MRGLMQDVPLTLHLVRERAGESLTAADLRTYLGERVASWQVPDVITFIDEVFEDQRGQVRQEGPPQPVPDDAGVRA